MTDGPGDAWPRWSPDGRWLVYESVDRREGSLIRILDLETPGAAPRVLGKGTHPDISPDGDWIVYSASTRWGPKLFKMHLDGSGRRSFGGSPYQELEPSISPDGRYVIYIGMLEGEEGIPHLVARPFAGGDDIALVLPQGGGGGLPVW